MLKIIYKEIGKNPIVKEIKNTLKEEQKLVDGLIEIVPYKEKYLLVCNEVGKIKNLKPNIYLGRDYIAGNFFIVGDDYENATFKSIEDKDIDEIINDLKTRQIDLSEEEDMYI